MNNEINVRTLCTGIKTSKPITKERSHDICQTRYFAQKVAYFEEIDKFWLFDQKPYFLKDFAKNLVKTLVHGTLHKKFLISRRSTSFGGFSPNATLFATFC